MNQPGGHICPRCGAGGARRAQRQSLIESWVLARSHKRPYRCRECRHRFFDHSRHAARRTGSSGTDDRHREPGPQPTVRLVLDLLLTRPAVWIAAIPATGAAIVAGQRISFLLAPVSAVAAALVAVGLIALYDLLRIGRHGIWRQPRNQRVAALKASLVAVLVTSSISGLILVVFGAFLWLFEPFQSYQPPISGGPAGG